MDKIGMTLIIVGLLVVIGSFPRPKATREAKTDHIIFVKDGADDTRPEIVAQFTAHPKNEPFKWALGRPNFDRVFRIQEIHVWDEVSQVNEAKGRESGI